MSAEKVLTAKAKSTSGTKTKSSVKKKKQSAEEEISEPVRKKKHPVEEEISEPVRKKKHPVEEEVSEPVRKKKHPVEEEISEPVRKKKRPVEEEVSEPVRKKKHPVEEEVSEPVRKKKRPVEEEVSEPVRKKKHPVEETSPVQPELPAKKKNTKLRLKKNVKIALFVICFAAIGGVALSMKPSLLNSAETGEAVESETEQETFPETTEEPTTEEPTTEEPTTEPIDENAPFIDYTLEIDPDKPMVAITYDDGPAPDSSAEILDVLEENHAHATFFIVGQNITPETKKIIRREAKIGCEVANHTWDHSNLRELSLEEGLAEIQDCDKAIYKIIHRYPQHIRPPYGAYTDELREEEKRMFIYWSLDTNDWKWRDADKVYELVMDNVGDGDIILMHDIHPETAEASKRIIPDLIEEGYQLVTVSELMYYRGFPEEDSMLLYNVHPTDPLYESMYGTVISLGDEDDDEKETDQNAEDAESDQNPDEDGYMEDENDQYSNADDDDDDAIDAEYGEDNADAENSPEE